MFCNPDVLQHVELEAAGEISDSSDSIGTIA